MQSSMFNEDHARRIGCSDRGVPLTFGIISKYSTSSFTVSTVYMVGQIKKGTSIFSMLPSREESLEENSKLKNVSSHFGSQNSDQAQNYFITL